MIVTIGAIKGAEDGFSNWALQLGVSKPVNFAREEESAEFKNMHSPRSPPPLIDMFKCCPAPPRAVSPERMWSV